jgi:hypothetical protein
MVSANMPQDQSWSVRLKYENLKDAELYEFLKAVKELPNF